MALFTARGVDSAEAMDQIIQRLGANAFILSTSVRNGLVEIQATDAPPEAGPMVSRAASGQAAGGFPDRASLVERAQSFADLLEARSDWAPPERLKPAVPPRRTPWSKVSPAAMLDAQVDKLEAELLTPDSLPTGQLMPRTVIAGPPGSGKSLLAARLAAATMVANPALTPRLIVPRTAVPLSDDKLHGWARLLGLRPERPLIGDLFQADADASEEPLATRPQIIDLSELSSNPAELSAALAQTMPTEIILTLPVGLSARRTLREASAWGAVSARLCLTFCDLSGPDRAQLAALAEAGLRLSRCAGGTGIIDTISVPDRAQLARWLQEEADENANVTAEARA